MTLAFLILYILPAIAILFFNNWYCFVVKEPVTWGEYLYMSVLGFVPIVNLIIFIVMILFALDVPKKMNKLFSLLEKPINK